MANVSDPRYLYCPRVGEAVCICRSEEACRGEFGCTKPDCPLGKEFGLEAFDRRMKAFATTFDLWPVGSGKEPDFP